MKRFNRILAALLAALMLCGAWTAVAEMDVELEIESQTNPESVDPEGLKGELDGIAELPEALEIGDVGLEVEELLTQRIGDDRAFEVGRIAGEPISGARALAVVVEGRGESALGVYVALTGCGRSGRRPLGSNCILSLKKTIILLFCPRFFVARRR